MGNILKAKIILPKLIKKDVINFFKNPINKKYNKKDYLIIPGLIDVHVHFREPGFSYKETIKSGTLAAAHGGYTSVCTMPNLNPISDTSSHIDEQLNIIKKDACINVYPLGSITINQLGKEISPIEEVANKVIAFSDDGKGIQDKNIMLEAMKRCKKVNKIIVAHCEVNDLVKGGYVNDGNYAKKHHHLGISNESEYLEVERDLSLAKKSGCKYHVCHVSTKESIALIAKAKKEGVDVTCETAPHYLLLDENNLKEDGNYKMNPPLRSKKDRLALLKAIKDGTIDMIATDHAPHSEIEKSKGLKDSLFGISGIDIAFPLLYTYLVKTKIITLNKLIELLVINPRERFGIMDNHSFSIWDMKKKSIIDKKSFLSKGKSSPFINQKIYGENLLTVINQKIVYKK